MAKDRRLKRLPVWAEVASVTIYRRCFTSDMLRSNVDRRKPVWKVARRRILVLLVSSN